MNQVQYKCQRSHDSGRNLNFSPVTSFLVFLIVFVFHERHSEYRVEHVGHKQRGKQRDNECNGQVVHKLAHDSRPECQWEEWGKRSQRSRQNGQEYFAGSFLCRRVDIGIETVQTVRILNHHNGIVNNNSEGQR